MLNKYNELKNKYQFNSMTSEKSVYPIIKKALQNFVMSCKQPAIWCYGLHTQMLMADFIFELKGVNYIIDTARYGQQQSGFYIINSNEILVNHIDGVIISSYVHKEAIREVLEKDYPQIKYLDIYQTLEENGISLQYNYFALDHPYCRYNNINRIQMEIESNSEEALRRKLIEQYIDIKDFKTAIKWGRIFEKECDDRSYWESICRDLEDICELQKKELRKISKNNVIMLCIDGLRRKDLISGLMPKMKKYIDNNMLLFINAYALSTSTYESLIPAYSENDDLRTEYYKFAEVSEEHCRFIHEAKKQGRSIYFYTDTGTYVDCKEIHMTAAVQTATEKIWQFMQDAQNEENGLFYIHFIWESHFPYVSPYTKQKQIMGGGNILFDYLPQKGGQIRANYNIRHNEGLNYLDDILEPYLNNLYCSMVLFADHGNVIFDEKCKLEEIDYTKFTFAEDLLQIPLAIKAPGTMAGVNNQLISLMSINDIIVCLLKNSDFRVPNNKFIKVVRSAIYNPDFKRLYKKAGFEKGLQAFELFVIDDKYKLAVYEDGSAELYSINDMKLEDKEILVSLYKQVQTSITVCTMEDSWAGGSLQ